MNSPLVDKSMDFAVESVKFFEEATKTKKDLVMANQFFRSATSVGANINEAVYGQSKADFIAKIYIALKEARESLYWLELMSKTNFYQYDYQKMFKLADEIIRMLMATVKTSKEKENKK